MTEESRSGVSQVEIMPSTNLLKGMKVGLVRGLGGDVSTSCQEQHAAHHQRLQLKFPGPSYALPIRTGTFHSINFPFSLLETITISKQQWIAFPSL